MTEDTREVVGRLARWALLAVCAVAGGGAALAVLAGLSPTLTAARGWSVTPDMVNSTRGYLRLGALSRPRLRMGTAGFYWRMMDDRLKDVYVGRYGTSYLRLPAEIRPGRYAVISVPNPYGSHGPGVRRSLAHLVAPASEVVLLDVRSVLALDAAGRLAADTEARWPATSHRAPLPALAEAATLAYLSPAPLADYDRVRNILQRAPLAAVLTAGTDWTTPGTAEDVLEVMKRIRRSVGRSPVLLTDEPALAAAVVEGGGPAILVGEHPSLPRPGRVFARWSEAVAHLEGR